VMSYEDDDGYWEAQQEAAEEEAYDRSYKEIGPQWARDHADELFRDHYEEAVSEFTSERLKSYYVKHPDLAISVAEALLNSIFPQVITKLGLNLHEKMTVCGDFHRENGRITVFPG